MRWVALPLLAVAGCSSPPSSTTAEACDSDQPATGTFERLEQGLRSATANEVALGDIDGDGDLDAVVAARVYGSPAQEADVPNPVWINDGRGGFSYGQALPATETRSVAMGDVDGDGHIDLVFGGSSPLLFLNDGRGRFDESLSLGTVPREVIRLADLDDDGDLDLLSTGTTNSGGNELSWEKNRGDGSFGLGGSVALPTAALDVAVGDLGGGPRLDVIVALGGTMQVVLDVASESTTVLPTFEGESGLWSLSRIKLADLDGDGDVDAFITGRGDGVLLNDGDGVFSTGQTFSGPNYGVNAVALADVDGDGDADAVLVQGTNDVPNANVLLINDGTGVFTAETILGYDTSAAASGDLDGDGNSDFFLGGAAAPSQAWLGDGEGGFTRSGYLGGSPCAVHSVLADLDGDLDLDLLVTTNRLGRSRGCDSARVLLNDGYGRLADSGQSLASPYGRASVVGDLDGDGDADAVVLQQSWPGELEGQVWRNAGDATFTAVGDPLATDNVEDADLGDLDGDGDLDLLLSHGAAAPATLWLNDGAAQLTAGDLGITTLAAGIAAGDLDGDGDIDLLAAAAEGGTYHVWLNQDGGQLAESSQALVAPTEPLAVLELGDLDGDGDLDALSVHQGAEPGGLLWFNDGTGRFTRTDLGDGGSFGDLGDVDGDGDLDVVLGSQVWLNDGGGNFHLRSDAGALGHQVVLGELDCRIGADAVYLVGNGIDVWVSR